MPFKKGQGKIHANQGKRGPNKSTGLAREAIARFVDGNAEKLGQWLDEIYQTEGPLAAFRCWADVVEYHVPKLARTEIAGDKDNPLTTVTKVELVPFVKRQD